MPAEAANNGGNNTTTEKSEELNATQQTKKAPVIFLFDVDGTLTMPRQKITDEMLQFMRNLSQRVPIAVVGGSDLCKIFEQLPNEDNELLKLFSFIFAENGLMGFEGVEELPKASITKELGEKRLQDLTNFCLRYMSEIDLPLKRGTFIELRNGMMNVCPIGRSCTQEERMSFVEYENKFPVRQDFVKALEQRFPVNENSLKFSIGGQISIDIFPSGWDKTFCLRYLEPKYEAIHFFGDKTMPGGNDYEIFIHPGTVGHSVTDPIDCCKQVTETLGQLGL
uniref:Phosphomannomutase n=1 Tax=Meloidogyne incognita TaxID=6306 RepID=A0A914KKN9_MELIC